MMETNGTEVGKKIRTSSHMIHLEMRQVIMLLTHPNLFNLGLTKMAMPVIGIKTILVIVFIVFL